MSTSNVRRQLVSATNRVSLFEALEYRQLMSVATVRTVAATGLPTGDLPGVNFNQVFTPSINDAGNVGFISNLAGPGYRVFDPAIWRGVANPLNTSAPATHGLVAAYGQVAPGTGGATYVTISGEANVNDRGQVTFYSQLTGGDANNGDRDTAQFVGTPGDVALRFRENQQVPGEADGVVYQDSIFGNGPARLGDGSVVGQLIEMRDNNGFGYHIGIAVGSLDSVNFVAKVGEPAPYGEAGRYSFAQYFSSPVTNDDGAVAFNDYLYDDTTSNPTSFQVVFFRGTDGVLKAAAAPGMALPDVGPGAVLGSADSPSLNGAGQIAFNALFYDPNNTNSDKGTFVGTPETGYQLVARNFQPAPGLPGVTMSAGSPLLNAQGQVVFQSSLFGPSIDSYNNESVWLWSPTDRSLKMVWREGTAVPSTTGDVVFGSLLQSPATNAQGQVLLRTGLRGADVTGNGDSRGIYATEPNGGALFKVVREGDQLTVAAGDVRTVTSLDVKTGTGGEDGRVSGLNDAGQIAYRALFGSSASGAFVADTVAAPAAVPTVVTTFNLNASSGPATKLNFSQGVLADVSSKDVSLVNLTTGQTFKPSIRVINSMQVELAAPAGYTDGNYALTVSSGAVADPYGRQLDGDGNGQAGGTLSYNFFALAGDANRDRHVDDADRAILNAHLNQAGTFEQGDFNHDGTINSADAAILDANWHVYLPAQGAYAVPTTTGSDAVTLKVASGQLQVFADSSGVPTYRIPLGAVTAFSFDGQAGNDSLTIVGGTGADNVTFNQSSIAFGGITVATANVEAMGFDGKGGADALTINGGPMVKTVGTQSLKTLSIGAAGKLDLADNDLIVTNTPQATIENYIKTADNFGGWDGAAGIFSSGASNNATGNTTLGLLGGNEYIDNTGDDHFDGVQVSASNVLVKYTYFGDVDFNGSVDASDYNLIDFGFANHLTGWSNGDADHSSGATDVSDYNLIDFAFNSQSGKL